MSANAYVLVVRALIDTDQGDAGDIFVYPGRVRARSKNDVKTWIEDKTDPATGEQLFRYMSSRAIPHHLAEEIGR